MPDSSFDPKPPKTPPISVSSITTEVNRTGSWKYIQPAYHDRVAPCIAGCPTGVDIAGYMALLKQGKIEAAADLLMSENPMPAITGRVCNHPCESVCNRIGFDGAVSIHAVERMLGDFILESMPPPTALAKCSERVAVVGSGPAGLACAYHLARIGYQVDVFEQDSEAGGMLRQGIPEYRLPRKVLNQQIELYKSMGIGIHTCQRAGEDLTWERLTNEYSAVFVGSGAQLSKTLQIGSETESAALLGGLEFLRRVNRGERPSLGRVVLVIGGGNTAMDCARVALRLGSDVKVVYRRTRAEMPAITEEVDDAEREGVEFVFLAAPDRMFSAEGRLGLACKRMRLADPDSQGRRMPVESEEAPLLLQADTIITAIGEDADLQVLPHEVREAKGLVDAWGTSPLANVFLGGDLAGDERTVASALGAGKRAAIGIDRYLSKRRGDVPREDDLEALKLGGTGAMSTVRWANSDPVTRVSPINTVVTNEEVNTSDFAHAKPHQDRHIGDASSFDESNRGLTRQEALEEAARCFECGICNNCELCQIYCSEAAIQRDPDSGLLMIDLEHCKGCGVCAVECPRGTITMERLISQM